MAFTDAQKASIRTYLGWSALYKDIDTRLEGQLVDLPVRDSSSATKVIAVLALLADIDTRLQAALDNLDLVKAEDITFLGPEQLQALRVRGRELVNQVAIIFELEPKRDYFGAGAGLRGGLIELG